MLPFRFAHAMRMRPLSVGRVESAFHPAIDQSDTIPIAWKVIAAMVVMMVNRKDTARDYHAGGQGMLLNLTLGAPPIGRPDSRSRP
jgi:hypothetical protein